MYDVIVLGARAAGSPTAMQLARKGFKVLLVDRASFPSDTLSTHSVQLKGVAALQRWGLLEKVLATNCPPVNRLSFHQGRFHLQGNYFPLEGLEAIICPRRTVLDKILVDAAVEAGAELRQDVVVEELLTENGTVTGIRGRMKSGSNGGETQIEEKARLVIGADGKHSLVAKQTQAPEYNVQPIRTCSYYTYWGGVGFEEGELHTLEDAMVGIWPTNDEQAVIYTGYPLAEFTRIRGDVDGRFWKTMESVPGLGEKLRSGTQTGRFFGTADLPGFYRRPYGDGWALVGDAGLTQDPITGQGIGNAFRDSERLVHAIEAGFSGKAPLEMAMAVYEKERNAETFPMYELTRQIASFEPASLQQEVLFASLENKPREVEQFFGILTGSIPVKEFFSPASVFRIIGIGGMGRMVLGSLKNSHQRKVLTSPPAR